VIAHDHEYKRGRTLCVGPHGPRWYKTGYAPCELPEYIKATCGRCGNDTLVIFARGAVCSTCSPIPGVRA
jgi:hypothetical protein